MVAFLGFIEVGSQPEQQSPGIRESDNALHLRQADPSGR
jgi:hypothetical protein